MDSRGGERRDDLGERERNTTNENERNGKGRREREREREIVFLSPEKEEQRDGCCRGVTEGQRKLVSDSI